MVSLMDQGFMDAFRDQLRISTFTHESIECWSLGSLGAEVHPRSLTCRAMASVFDAILQAETWQPVR